MLSDFTGAQNSYINIEIQNLINEIYEKFQNVRKQNFDNQSHVQSNDIYPYTKSQFKNHTFINFILSFIYKNLEIKIVVVMLI